MKKPLQFRLQTLATETELLQTWRHLHWWHLVCVAGQRGKALSLQTWRVLAVWWYGRKKPNQKPRARIYQMRKETAITSSPNWERIPHNFFQPCVFCFPFWSKNNPHTQCNVYYLTGEMGEGTNSTICARCFLSGNQLCLGSIPQSLWVEKLENDLFLENLCKMPNL